MATIPTSPSLLMPDNPWIAEKMRRIEEAVGDDGWYDVRIQQRDGVISNVSITINFHPQGGKNNEANKGTSGRSS